MYNYMEYMFELICVNSSCLRKYDKPVSWLVIDFMILNWTEMY